MINETENQIRLRRAKESVAAYQDAETEARKALAGAIESTKRAREKHAELFIAEEKRERELVLAFKEFKVEHAALVAVAKVAKNALYHPHGVTVIDGVDQNITQLRTALSNLAAVRNPKRSCKSCGRKLDKIKGDLCVPCMFVRDNPPSKGEA